MVGVEKAPKVSNNMEVFQGNQESQNSVWKSGAGGEEGKLGTDKKVLDNGNEADDKETRGKEGQGIAKAKEMQTMTVENLTPMKSRDTQVAAQKVERTKPVKLAATFNEEVGKSTKSPDTHTKDGAKDNKGDGSDTQDAGTKDSTKNGDPQSVLGSKASLEKLFEWSDDSKGDDGNGVAVGGKRNTERDNDSGIEPTNGNTEKDPLETPRKRRRLVPLTGSEEESDLKTSQGNNGALFVPQEVPDSENSAQNGREKAVLESQDPAQRQPPRLSQGHSLRISQRHSPRLSQAQSPLRLKQTAASTSFGSLSPDEETLAKTLIEKEETSYGSLSPDEEAPLHPPTKRRSRIAQKLMPTSKRRLKKSSDDDSFIVADENVIEGEDKEVVKVDVVPSDLYAGPYQPEAFGDWDYLQHIDEEFEKAWKGRKKEREEEKRIRDAQGLILLDRPPESAFESPSKTKPLHNFDLPLDKCIRLYCRAIQKSVRPALAQKSVEAPSNGETERYQYVVDKVEEVHLRVEARNHIMDGRWQTELLQALEHRPYLKVETLEKLKKEGHVFTLPGFCDACHYRKHTPALVFKFAGPKATPNKMWPMYWEGGQHKDLHSEDDSDEETFFVGYGCVFKAVWYHRAFWLRDAIAQKAKEGVSTGRLKQGGLKATEDILDVAKELEHKKKTRAMKNLGDMALNINKEVEESDYDPWVFEKGAEGSVLSISSSDESVRNNEDAHEKRDADKSNIPVFELEDEQENAKPSKRAESPTLQGVWNDTHKTFR